MTLKNKPKISISIEQELIDWIDSKIKKKYFANRSHAIERALTELKEKIDKN